MGFIQCISCGWEVQENVYIGEKIDGLQYQFNNKYSNCLMQSIGYKYNILNTLKYKWF